MIKIPNERVPLTEGNYFVVNEKLDLKEAVDCLQTMADSYQQPIKVVLENIKVGGILSDSQPGVAFYHKTHIKSYYTVVFVEEIKGLHKQIFLQEYLAGNSSNYAKEIAGHNTKGLGKLLFTVNKKAQTEEYEHYQNCRQLLLEFLENNELYVGDGYRRL